jgi:hypothetical protein
LHFEAEASWEQADTTASEACTSAATAVLCRGTQGNEGWPGLEGGQGWRVVRGGCPCTAAAPFESVAVVLRLAPRLLRPAPPVCPPPPDPSTLLPIIAPA